MGAVAVSEQDESIMEVLKRSLGLPSKAQVIHRALKELQMATAREELARQIHESVKKCAQADLQENLQIRRGALHDLEKL